MLTRKATLLLTSLLLIAVLPLLPQTPTRAQETSHTFPETGKTVRGIFLQYWTTHGGLAQQGYPISDEMMLKSTDGKEYRTQFFQRAVFEHHPEFAGTPNEVLLKLVGQTFYERHFQTSPPPNQTVNPTNTITFKESGHSIGGKFRAYWEQHGGLTQQGYPMTDEFKMSSTDGKEYTTQVFQRAVFELHPEFAGSDNEVLLRLLGVEEWEQMNGSAPPTEGPGAPTSIPQVTPTAENQSLLGPEDYQTAFVGKDGQTHTFTYDNAPESEDLLTVALTLDTQEDKDDYAELLKRSGRTSDFSFIVAGYDESTGEPPEGWFGYGYNAPGGPILEGIMKYDENGNLLFKYRNRNTLNPVKNNAVLARIYGTNLGRIIIYASMSDKNSNGVITTRDFYNQIGGDPTALRIAHKMGFDVNGYESDFAEKAWPTFWTIRRP